MAVAFNSFEEAEEYIRLHESRTKEKYILLFKKRIFSPDFTSLAKAPIKFDVRQGLKIPFSKVPFVNIAREARECHYGPGRSKPKYTGPDDPNRKRRRLRRIKKMGCPAIIKIKTVIYLPRFKVSDPVTKYKIRLAVNEMRTQEVRPEDKQMKVFVLFCNKHQNHPGLQYTAASVSKDGIHDLVPEPISEEIVPGDYSIEAWLNSCKLSKHVQSFHDRGYYFARQLGHITLDHLLSWDIKKTPANKIWHALQKMFFNSKPKPFNSPEEGINKNNWEGLLGENAASYAVLSINNLDDMFDSDSAEIHDPATMATMVTKPHPTVQPTGQTQAGGDAQNLSPGTTVTTVFTENTVVQDIEDRIGYQEVTKYRYKHSCTVTVTLEKVERYLEPIPGYGSAAVVQTIGNS